MNIISEFKLMSSKNRYEYIRKLALEVNLNRINNVINNIKFEKESFFKLTPDLSHYSKLKNNISQKNEIISITSVWSKKKMEDESLKNYVKEKGLKNTLYDFDISGVYLEEYGILFSVNDNHRICHGQLFGDYEIKINIHYRVEHIELNNIFYGLDIENTNLPKNEKVLYILMQENYKLNKSLKNKYL